MPLAIVQLKHFAVVTRKSSGWNHVSRTLPSWSVLESFESWELEARWASSPDFSEDMGWRDRWKLWEVHSRPYLRRAITVDVIVSYFFFWACRPWHTLRTMNLELKKGCSGGTFVSLIFILDFHYPKYHRWASHALLIDFLSMSRSILVQLILSFYIYDHSPPPPRRTRSETRQTTFRVKAEETALSNRGGCTIRHC